MENSYQSFILTQDSSGWMLLLKNNKKVGSAGQVIIIKWSSRIGQPLKEMEHGPTHRICGHFMVTKA